VPDDPIGAVLRVATEHVLHDLVREKLHGDQPLELGAEHDAAKSRLGPLVGLRLRLSLVVRVGRGVPVEPVERVEVSFEVAVVGGYFIRWHLGVRILSLMVGALPPADDVWGSATPPPAWTQMRTTANESREPQGRYTNMCSP
jgi:hypothetical protein